MVSSRPRWARLSSATLSSSAMTTLTFSSGHSGSTDSTLSTVTRIHSGETLSLNSSNICMFTSKSYHPGSGGKRFKFRILSEAVYTRAYVFGRLAGSCTGGLQGGCSGRWWGAGACISPASSSIYQFSGFFSGRPIRWIYLALCCAYLCSYMKVLYQRAEIIA